jgi:hypothetical protein
MVGLLALYWIVAVDLEPCGVVVIGERGRPVSNSRSRENSEIGWGKTLQA